MCFCSLYYLIKPKTSNKLYQFLFVCFLILYYYYYNYSDNYKKNKNKDISNDNCFMMIINIILYISLLFLNAIILFIIKTYNFYIRTIQNYNDNNMGNSNIENNTRVYINTSLDNSYDIVPINLYDYNSNINNENNYNCDDCVICLDPLTTGNLSKLDCNHFYHKLCLEEWSLQQRTCPICKLDF